jgi:excisionase family DNA binding protein
MIRYTDVYRSKELRRKRGVPTDEVYTVEEAAKLLKVDEMTIRRMIDRKEIVASRVGRSIRIPRSELEKYLNPRQI